MGRSSRPVLSGLCALTIMHGGCISTRSPPPPGHGGVHSAAWGVGRWYKKKLAEAHACEHILPPRVKEKIDAVIDRPGHINVQVNILDPANEIFDDQVSTLTNTFVASNLVADYMVNGNRKQGAVSCTCGAPRTDRFPCVHNVKHVFTLVQTPTGPGPSHTRPLLSQPAQPRRRRREFNQRS